MNNLELNNPLLSSLSKIKSKTPLLEDISMNLHKIMGGVINYEEQIENAIKYSNEKLLANLQEAKDELALIKNENKPSDMNDHSPKNVQVASLKSVKKVNFADAPGFLYYLNNLNLLFSGCELS